MLHHNRTRATTSELDTDSIMKAKHYGWAADHEAAPRCPASQREDR
eukprot:SAG31_NODE_1691_length_7513_cov_11.746830_5_plen_46_part_00